MITKNLDDATVPRRIVPSLHDRVWVTSRSQLELNGIHVIAYYRIHQT
jgi:hypothetical protein